MATNKKKDDEQLTLADMGNQPSWQENRDRIIAGMGNPIEPSWQENRDRIVSGMGSAVQPSWHDIKNQRIDEMIARQPVPPEREWQANRDNEINKMAARQPYATTADQQHAPQQRLSSIVSSQPSWQDNRDAIIAGMGTQLKQVNEQKPVQMNIGVTPEIYTQEQANAARKYNEGLRNQVQGKGNFTPGYMTEQPVRTIEQRQQPQIENKVYPSHQEQQPGPVIVRGKIDPQQPMQQPTWIDESNLFGYPSTQNQGKSAFYQWQDRNVQGNLAKMGDPNSFNSLGNEQNTKRPDDYVVRGKIPPLPEQSQQQIGVPKPSAMPQQQQNPPQRYYTGNDPAEIAREKAGWYTNGSGYRSQEDSQVAQKPQPQGNNSLRQVAAPSPQAQSQQQPTSYVNRVTDQQGNALSRADLQAMDRERDINGLINAARGTGDPSRDMIYQQKSQEALRSLGGYHGAPLASEIAKDNATARHTNVTSDLAPGLAQAEIGLRGAQANRYNTENQYAAKEYDLKKMGVESTANYHNALAKQALNGKPHDSIEAQKLHLDRQIAAGKEYQATVENNLNMTEPQKNKLKREIEVKYGLKQRRSASEFQN